MQAPFICIRCQQRILQRSINPRRGQVRRFVPLVQNNWLESTQQSPDNVISSKQKETDRFRLQTARPLQAEQTDDDISAVVDELFDASRHRLPSSSKSRYSGTLLSSHHNGRQRFSQAPTAPIGLAGSSLPTPTPLKEVQASNAANKGLSGTNSGITSERNSVKQKSPAAPPQHGKSSGPRSPQPQRQTVNSTKDVQQQRPIVGNPVIQKAHASFDEDLAHIQRLFREDGLEHVPELLRACERIELPEEGTKSRIELNELMKSISEELFNVWKNPLNLPTSNDYLRDLMYFYAKYQSILQGWFPRLLCMYLTHLYVSKKWGLHGRADLSRRGDVIVKDLVTMWSFYFSTVKKPWKRPVRKVFNRLPKIKFGIVKDKKFSPDFEGRMQQLFSRVPGEDITHISSLLLLTCALMHDTATKLKMSRQRMEDAKAFVSWFENIIRGADINTAKLQQFWPWRPHGFLLQWRRFELHLGKETGTEQSSLGSESSIDGNESTENWEFLGDQATGPRSLSNQAEQSPKAQDTLKSSKHILPESRSRIDQLLATVEKSTTDVSQGSEETATLLKSSSISQERGSNQEMTSFFFDAISDFESSQLKEIVDSSLAESNDTFGQGPRRTSVSPLRSSDYHMRDFDQAVQAGHTLKMYHLWERFRAQLGEDQYETKDLTLKFTVFLRGFAKLRKLGRINEVWSEMVTRGVKPTVDHWNAIFFILQKNRELGKFENVWQAMLDAGCDPDNKSWTIYFTALLRRGFTRKTLQMLRLMGETWRKALHKKSMAGKGAELRLATTVDDDDLERQLPSMVPINAAITGLLVGDHLEWAEEILHWARTFPVDIDASTYNIFLLDRYRKGDTEGAEALLKDMETKNVAPDVITKTIILDSKLRNAQSPLLKLAPSEQEEIIIQELQKMWNEGHQPSTRTYAVVLHFFLHHVEPNVPAANALFRLLLRQHRTVPPHIYTIILTHYFNSSNPDLNALDTLWHKLEKENGRIDHVLYDRMIGGYASIGELKRMMLFFRKMTEAGHVTGWLALQRALSALVQERRWEDCAMFVADVISEGGHLHLGKRGWRGEKAFLQLVRELEQQGLIPKYAALNDLVENKEK